MLCDDAISLVHGIEPRNAVIHNPNDDNHYTTGTSKNNNNNNNNNNKKKKKKKKSCCCFEVYILFWNYFQCPFYNWAGHLRWCNG